MRNLLFALLLFSLSINCSAAQPTETATHEEKKKSLGEKTVEACLYFGTGALFGTASLLARIGWGGGFLFPWTSNLGKECLLFSYLTGSSAQKAFTHLFFPQKQGSSFLSWEQNYHYLEQIPTVTPQERQLIHFLEKRWLAKSTGFFPLMIDWVYPCFGLNIQVHPETTSHYARDPSKNLSQTYINRVDEWKSSLPHPREFPLILTRPHNLSEYLPYYIGAKKGESPEALADRVALQAGESIVDLSTLFDEQMSDPLQWRRQWEAFEPSFSAACQERGLDLRTVYCIELVQQEHIGGIRILPFSSFGQEEIAVADQTLLEWVSVLGITANRIELDRWTANIEHASKSGSTIPASFPAVSREECLSEIRLFEEESIAFAPHEELMIMGTLQAIKSLLATVPKERWQEIFRSPTLSAIASLSFFQIQKNLNALKEEGADSLFFDKIARVEEIHASLSALIEISSPFTLGEFPAIYHSRLTLIPESLKPFTQCALHTSGMTSLSGILRAVEKSNNASPNILFGENTYYEAIIAAETFGSTAVEIEHASQEDWSRCDLLLAQFNPALKRIHMDVKNYIVEDVGSYLRQALSADRDKPLTLALDCTFDYIDSPRVGSLLEGFEEEIISGKLNVVGYRSGLKFDLFGMDNYCGAPLFMIHNSDAKWENFDTLLTNPVLQSDRLSANWFCLAYNFTAPYLERYREMIFNNTRALLNKLPATLFEYGAADYRVVPMANEADAAFIDIKITGPFHTLRGSTLAGGTLFMHCMESGHPVFYRPSVGFYHPNYTMLFADDQTTIRLTLGVDPDQVDAIAEGLKKLDTLNHSLWPAITGKGSLQCRMPENLARLYQ